MKRKAFISGPIQGMETEQSYRNVIREICVRCGYEHVDPWQREKVTYTGTKLGWWMKIPAAGFIRRDLEDIEKCDVLIACLSMLSAGTCMELFYVKLKGKKTVSICQIKNPARAFIDLICLFYCLEIITDNVHSINKNHSITPERMKTGRKICIVC